LVTTNANTFTNLFCTAPTVGAAQTLFFGAGSGVGQASEFSYKGPYLANDAAGKTDPWGFRYLVLGYNQTGMAGNLPIYIVCAGPNGTISAANFAAGMGPATGIWLVNAANAVSQDDIYVRVN
jgi:hypothetical protein